MDLYEARVVEVASKLDALGDELRELASTYHNRSAHQPVQRDMIIVSMSDAFIENWAAGLLFDRRIGAWQVPDLLRTFSWHLVATRSDA